MLMRRKEQIMHHNPAHQLRQETAAPGWDQMCFNTQNASATLHPSALLETEASQQSHEASFKRILLMTFILFVFSLLQTTPASSVTFLLPSRCWMWTTIHQKLPQTRKSLCARARGQDRWASRAQFSVFCHSPVWSNTRKAMSAARTPGLYPRLCAERLFPSAVWVDYWELSSQRLWSHCGSSSTIPHSKWVS